jgi:methylglyoxal/glyoxal reductase
VDLTLASTIELNNGLQMPRFGLGVYQTPDGEPTVSAVTSALEAGYRHIDTAKMYRNEVSVGRAVRDAGVPREQIWVTTKLWPLDFSRVESAFSESLQRLGLDYVDLYLVHFPLPGRTGHIWRAMEQIAQGGRARAIGVSNYSARRLAAALPHTTVAPAVNQVRCSPFKYSRELYELCQRKHVAYEAYSPLHRGKGLDNVILTDIAHQYTKTSAQGLLRWALQKNMVVIPKSVQRERIIANADVFDFALSDADMARLEMLS